MLLNSLLPTLATALFCAAPRIVLGDSLPSENYDPTVPRWEWIPSYGPLPGEPKGSYLTLKSGVSLWYAELGTAFKGKQTPVLLLHGGTANSNAMYQQAKELVKDRYVIVTDTRGQGRSPYSNFTEMHYDDFARDAIAILDHLNVSKVGIVGWSDGAITGLNIAMNYTTRVDRLFAHAANAQYNLSIPEYGTFPSIAGYYLDTRQTDDDPYSYSNLSPTPEKQEAMENAVVDMWLTEPAWGSKAFAKIKVPTWIVDGDRDGQISRNQPDAMASWAPFAGQLILPQVGHFALLEDPKFFNFAMRYFLEMQYGGELPLY